jgi:predicted DNA-binding transcriptional regulator YafY
MATTKNALIRYKTLDQCFRNVGKNYCIEDLIDECNKVLLELDTQSDGISLRQIREDIKFMRSEAGWSIEFADLKDGKKKIYRYADPHFSINNMPLNEIEISQLESALAILTQFNGMPQFEWISELIPKLKQGMSTKDQDQIVIDFDSNKYLRGIDYLGPLYNAVFYKKVLKINYQPFENETPYELIIHPYFLKQYNNRWFLFGYNPENNKYDWNLALDRICSVKEVEGMYQVNNVINWDEYFEDIIGVTKPIERLLEHVTLHFYGKTGKYIETKPLHGSQKSKWIDNAILEVNLDLIINYEFERLVLSYADNVKVIQPKKFQLLIKERLKIANEFYN